MKGVFIKNRVFILLFISMIQVQLVAQFSFFNETPTSSVRLVTCAGSDTLSISFTNSSAQTNVGLGIKLPTNISLKSWLSGGSIIFSSSDSLYINFGNLSIGQTSKVDFLVSANCNSISNSSVIIKYRVNSSTASQIYNGINYSSSLYVPILQFNPISKDTVDLVNGSIHQRRYILSNISSSVVSYFDTILYVSKFKAGESYLDLKINGITISPIIIGDSVTLKISGSMLDTDGKLNGGQSVIVEERVQIVNRCILNNNLNDLVRVSWGCNSQNCISPLQIAPSTKVEIVKNQQVNAYTFSRYAQCRGSIPDTLYFMIANPTSAGKAVNVTFNIESNFADYNFDSRQTINYFLAGSLVSTYNGAPYNLLKDTIQVLEKHEQIIGGVRTGAPIWYNGVPNTAVYNFRFRLDSMNAGDTIRGTLLYTMNCADSAMTNHVDYYWRIASPGFGSWSTPGLKNLRSRNECLLNDVFSHPGTQANRAPGVFDNYFSGNAIGSIIGDENFYPSSMNKIRILMDNQAISSRFISVSRSVFMLRIILPNGVNPLSVTPLNYPIRNLTNNAIAFNAYRVNLSGNNLEIFYRTTSNGSFSISNRYLDLNLSLNCSSLSGSRLDKIQSKWFVNFDTTCSSSCGFVNFSRTTDLPVSLKCANSFTLGGLDNTDYEHRRWNLGLADYNNDGLPDGTTIAHKDSVDGITYTYGDTMMTKQAGRLVISGSSPGGGFSRAYAVHKLVWPNSYYPNDTGAFSPIGTNLVVKRSSTVSYGLSNVRVHRLRVLDTVYYTYILEADSLRGQGSFPSSFSWTNNDSISLTTFYRFRKQQNSEDVYLLNQENDLFFTNTIITPTNKSSIDTTTRYKREERFAETDIMRQLILSPINGSVSFSTVSSCMSSNYDVSASAGLTQRLYSRVVFKNEYRPLKRFKFWQIPIVRKGVFIDSIRVNYNNGIGLSIWQRVPISALTLNYNVGFARIDAMQVLNAMSLPDIIDEGATFTIRTFFRRHSSVLDFNPVTFPASQNQIFEESSNIGTTWHNLPYPNTSIIGDRIWISNANEITKFINPNLKASTVGLKDRNLSSNIDTTSYLIRLDNLLSSQNMTADSAWIYFKSNHGIAKILSARNNITGVSYPITNNRLIKLGTIAPNSGQTIRLLVENNSPCLSDSFKLYYSWNCASIISPTDSTSLSEFYIHDSTFHFINKIEARLESSISVSKTSNLKLCDSIVVTNVVSNISNGAAFNIDFSFNSPNFGAGIYLIPGSYKLRYPIGGTGVTVTLPNPIEIQSGVFKWFNVNQHIPKLDTSGLAAFTDTTNNKLAISYTLRMQCGVSSGLNISNTVKARCNKDSVVNYSPPISLAAASKVGNQFYSILLPSDTIYSCLNTTNNQLIARFYNLASSAGSTTISDSFFITLPKGIVFDAGSTSSPRVPDRIRIQPDNTQLLVWSVNGLAPGQDRLHSFSVKVTNDYDCIGLSNVNAKALAFVSDTCITDGSICASGVLNIEQNAALRILKPQLSISNMESQSIQHDSLSEKIALNFKVTNSGYHTNRLNYKLIWDKNGDGLLNFADSVLTYDTLVYNLNTDSSVVVSTSKIINSKHICSLYLVLDSNNCQCSRSLIRLSNVRLKNVIKDTTVCNRSKLSIGVGASSNSYIYLWTPSLYLSDSTISAPEFFHSGFNSSLDSTLFVLKTTRAMGCISNDSVKVFIRPYIYADAGPDTSRYLCAGDSVQIGTTSLAGYTYSWSPTSGLNFSNIAQPIAKPVNSTTYFLTVTNTANGCRNYDTVTVNAISSNLVAFSRDYLRTCRGATNKNIGLGTPNSGGVAPFYYSWTPNTFLNNTTIANPSLTPSAGGDYTYIFRVTDSKGCTASDTTKVIIDTLPPYAAGTDTSLCQGNQAFIGKISQSKINYTWNPSTYLNSSTISRPLFSGIVAGINPYILTVTDSSGECSLNDTIVVSVNPIKRDTLNQAICKGQVYNFKSTNLQTSGIYRDTLMTVKGCDSFIILNLLVKDTTSRMIFDTICSNQVRLFNGVNRTTTGIYKDTLTNSQGCDSFLYLNLFVKPTSSYAFNASICNNNPYNFNGQNLTTVGTYFDTLTNSQGCDSFLTLNLSVSNTTSHTLNIAICKGQFYAFNGQNRTTTGTYLDTLTNAKNCDSFLTLNLTVKDTSTRTIFDTICKNQTRSFNNQTLNTTGIYKDTLMNAQGCDSFLYLNLLVKDTTSRMIFDTICSNQVRLFNGVNRTTTGIYKDTLTNSQGCDSFLYLNLFVKPTSSYAFNASICNNNPYNFNGQNLTTAGTYFDTLINSQGCDSFLTLNLSVSNTTSHTLNIAICKGQFYAFNGQNRTTTGTYLDTLTNAKNCDSFLTLNLTVKDTSTRTIFDTICKNQTRSFNNQILNTTGIYKDTLTNAQGCDSFLYLNLLVKDTTSRMIFDTICSNQVRPFNGINRTTTGIYKDTLTNSQGCDSFLYLNLFVKPTSSYTFNASICNNNPYNFNGQNLTTAGTYFDTLTNSQGCDSFLTLNLSVSNATSHTLNIAICKGQFYTFNGQNRTTTGTYLDTLTNAKNCDSFLTLNLTVKDTSTRTIFDTICKNQTRNFNNQTLNTTGIYKDTLTNAQGCDSFLYLNLHVKDTSSKQIFDTICSNQVRLFNGINRTTTGIYKDTLINAQGCDSFLYLNLFVKPTSSYAFNASICNNNPYSFNGQNLTTAGTYFDTLTNSQGCDSFLTLNLSVSNTTSHTLNIAICKGQFYTFNGQNRTATGTYLDTLTNAKNCDSFLTLNLTVKDTSTRTIFDTICKNQTRNFNNQTLNTTGIYKDTLTNAQGCDSFLYLNLLVKDTTSRTIFDTICSNQVRPFNGINRTTTGIYKDTLINAQGCDSFLYLNLFVKPTSSYTFNASICNNNPYSFNGQNLTTAGTYFDTLTNSQGCDSFLTLNLSVSNTTSHTLNIAICKGQFYTFNGQNRTATGTYLDTLTNAKNCDSFLTLNLTVKDTSTRTIFDTICKNQTRNFNNQTLSTTGIYKDTLTNAQGCDSFLYLNLHVKDTTSQTIFDTICSNQVRPFNGVNRTTTGIYKDTLTNTQGCDSFLYLNLFVKPTSSYTFNASICNNNPYSFNGQNLTTAGTYFDTLTNSQGCDSFLTLNLSVSNTTSHTLNIAICKGQFYTFNGQNRTTTGTYLDTLTNAKNCDSFLTLNLTVKDTSTRTIFDTICKNQTRSFNNQILNTTGIYKDTLTNAQGCDSFLYLNLHVKDTSSKQIFDTICSNQVRPFNGINRTTTGIYKDTLINAQGCDSFLYLHLFVKPTSSYTFNASICNNNPYTFNGQNLTTAGTYFDTLTNSQGCDSFVTLNLSVSNTTSHTLNIAICKGQFYTFNGQNRTTTGTYLDTLTNAKNCDSFLTLNLTVKDTSTRTIFDTICKNQTRNFNNQTLNTTGIYKDTLTNAQGCDSFLYLNLLVKDTTSKTIFDTICSNQVRPFNGINRTTAGIYKDTLTNSQGCDSFLYLNLFVKPTSSYAFNASICNNNPYNFNGQNLTTAGTYFDTLINSQGCDSFLTLNLSVSNTTSHTLNIAICKGQFYAFNGQNRTTMGTYLDTLTNAKNCDSFLTLNLTVKDTSTRTIFDTICKNQTRNFNNQTLNTTGIYKDTLTNAQGCDSFLYLNLLVKDTTSKTIFDTICSNQVRPFNGINRTTTGIYKDTLINAQGCDSFLYLNLFVKPTSSYAFNASICNNNPYNFNGQNLTTAGTYFDTLINSQGCDSFLTLNLSVSNTTSHTLNIAICKGQFYAFNGQNRTTTGTYLDTLTNAKNCDSFLTLNLTVKDTSTKMIYDTICKNQTRNFNNQTLNATGIYKDTLTNSQGCDSFLYLNLHVKDTSRKDSFRTICKNQPIIFNGNSLNTSGVYRDTFVNAQGCDSFLVLNLTVNDTTKKDSFRTICRYNPIVFNGQTLNTSGIYRDTLINSKGCDSFLYLHLTVNDTTRKDSFKTICKNQTIVFNGQNLNVSGLYKDTLVNIKGCDSFLYLHLIVNDTSHNDSFKTICKNQPILFNGQSLNVSGLYRDTLINSLGCDSFIYLYLSVNDTARKDSSVIICKNQPIVFNGQTLNTTGIYKDTFTNSQGCDSFLYLHLTVKDTSSYLFTKQICQGDSVIFNNIVRTLDGLYRDTAVNAAGCDSFIYLRLIVNPLPIANAGNDALRYNCKGDSVQLGSPSVTGIGYQWSPSGYLSSSIIAQPWAKPIVSTQYVLKVTNLSTTCFSHDTIKVDVQNIAITAQISKTNLTCFNDNSGRIRINPIGGIRPYLFWVEGKTTPQFDSTITGLNAGNEYYRIEDAKGCELRDTFSLTQPQRIEINLVAKKNLRCYQINEGEIEVKVTGGTVTSDYDYNWSGTGMKSKKIINLGAGQHAVTVTDNNGCTASFTETLVEPSNLVIQPKIIQNKCFGDSTASIELQVSQATSPYRYKWSNDSIRNINTRLKEGKYWATIIDANLCEFVSDTYRIKDYDKLVIDSTVSTPSGCGLRQSGALVIYAKGGVRDYLYSIDSGNRYSRDSNFEALKPGVYQIVIRDKNACTARTIDSVKGSARLEMAFLPKDTSIKLGQELQVSSFIIEGQARWINDIQWSPTEGLSCTDCLAPQISTFVSQRYKVRIRYFKDCYIEDYIKVRVISDDEIYIPNSFSPNATVSDENKTFKVYGKNITVARMRIFNRWGEKVYETEDAQFEGWDGTYKGEPQPAGVYIYYLELEFLDRRKITKTAEVNLMR